MKTSRNAGKCILRGITLKTRGFIDKHNDSDMRQTTHENIGALGNRLLNFCERIGVARP